MPAKPSLLILPEDHYEATAADRSNERQEQELGMVPPDSPVLTVKAQTVSPDSINDRQVQEVITRLYAAARGQRLTSRTGKKGRRTLVGLAATQIGEPLRIVLIDTKVGPDRKHYSQPECFINPEIMWRSQETAESREGCFSTGLVWGMVRRPIAVKIRGLTPQGILVERILEGFTARIAQHEIDHLNGIRFPERVRSDKKRHWVHAEELPAYIKSDRRWPRLCTKERWERLKTPA